MVDFAEWVQAGRVTARRVRSADADAVAAMTDEGYEHLRPWFPWVRPESTDPDWQRRRVREIVDPAWAEGSTHQLLLEVDRKVVGMTGLHRRVGPGGVEIGYWLHPDAVGHGYVTTAVGALTRLAFDQPDVSRVEIRCDEADVRSQGVPQRLGFRLDRTIDKVPEAPGETGRYQVWVCEDAPPGSVMWCLRPARADDAQAIASLHERCWHEGYVGLVPDEALARVDPVANEARFRSWIAEAQDSKQSGRVVHVIQVGSGADAEVVGHLATLGKEITNVYVSPDHWRQGLGRLLVRHAHDVLRAAGHTEAALWTIVGNDRAVALYESEGWQITGDRELHDTSAGFPVEEILLTRTL